MEYITSILFAFTNKDHVHHFILVRLTDSVGCGCYFFDVNGCKWVCLKAGSSLKSRGLSSSFLLNLQFCAIPHFQTHPNGEMLVSSPVG